MANGFKFTPAQQKAIEDTGKNILVAASAGSGKTRVLVERVINKIKQGVSIDELLVVTFTEAAAKEMKERIQIALRKELSTADSEEEKRRYLTQLSKLNVANISTLHAFCLQIIKQYYYVINLDPMFRMLTEDTEVALLQENVWDDLREKWYSKKSPEFENLVINFSSDRNDDGLSELVMKTYQFANANPNPEEWLNNLVNEYELGDQPLMESNFYQNKIKPNVLDQIQLAKDNLKQGMDEANKIGLEKLYQTFEQDCVTIDELQDFVVGCKEWNNLKTTLQNFKFKRAKSDRGLDDDQKKQKERINKTLRDGSKKIIEDLSVKYFALPEDEIKELTQKSKQIVETLSEVVKEFGSEFSKEKRRRHVLDFSDLEHLTLQILNTDTPDGRRVKERLKNKFKEIMVDEYQDTNQLQETILTTIAHKNPGNMFMVGDVKQSIYGFRLADPGLFLKKYQSFATDDNNDERIILAENFRSMENVTAFTNLIFSQLMDEKVGEMAYDEDARLVYGAKYYPEETPIKAEVLVYESEDSSQESDDEPVNEDFSIDNKAQGQIVMTAKRIKELVENGEKIYDKKQGTIRPIEYRDIAILAPTRKNNLILTEEFKRLGVPIFVPDAQNYFQTTELKIMMSFLQIIDNPYQDIPLVAVLRSPIVGLKENELAYLRINDKTGDYFQAVESFYDNFEVEKASAFAQSLYEKIAIFLKQLTEFRNMAQQNELASLIWKIYEETGFLDYVGGMPGGLQRQANLHALYERAAEYEEMSFKGLFQFVRFINKMQTKNKDLSEATTQVSDDAVTVMTIHGSKGLEFPVVFLLDATHKFNVGDLNKPYLLNADDGIGISYLDPDTRVKTDTLMKVIAGEQALKKLAAEQMRLLYVALTRAEQQLFIVGSYKDKNEALSKWEKATQSESLVLNAGIRASVRNFMDWIGMCLTRSEIFKEVDDTVDAKEPAYIGELPVKFAVKFYSNQDLREENITLDENGESWLKQQLKKIEGQEPLEINDKQYRIIDKILQSKYPNESLTKTTAYQAVSDLKRAFDDPDNNMMQSLEIDWQDQAPQGINRYVQGELKLPKFMTTKVKVSPAQVGTATHLLLQKLPLDDEVTLEELMQLLSQLVEDKLITPEVAKEINLNQIKVFYTSDLGRKVLKNKDKVKRELPFAMIIPAGRLFSNVDNDVEQPILVHGIIDGLIELDDEVIIFDYKTDHHTSEDKLIENYRGQLNLYAMAVESMLNKKVSQKIIYSLDLGKSIVL